MSGLTNKQEMFCREYLTDLNATQAAIRAGYRPKGAHVTASRLMAKPVVRKHIEKLKTERAERTQITSDYVLKRLVEIDKLDIRDILLDNGDIKQISEWSEGWRRSIQSVEVVAKKEGGETVFVKKVKIPDKIKNLELLGKHIEVSAFKDKMELTGKNNSELIINVTSPEAKENLKQLRDKLQNK